MSALYNKNMDNHTEKQGEDLGPPSCFFLYIFKPYGYMVAFFESYTTIFSDVCIRKWEQMNTMVKISH
ncbi:hypothetical protein BK131_28045 [Paenibacillus amylolyticus]|uniref:Uncharacterized protein n=1 Tax=Paenibacillus amylolyticus TaxID=1451 RepID=A0A1R1BG56_PAEAM|nr:hypothetical protein BK131_28045 [Paenibacillus amylolyticus]